MKASSIEEAAPSKRLSRVLPYMHLAGLAALAFAQPLFDLLGRHPEFFVIRGSQPVDLWLLAFGAVVLLPVPLLLSRLAAGFVGPRAAATVQVGLVGLLVGLLALQGLRQADAGELWWPAALLAGAAAAALYLVAPVARLFATYLSVAVIVLPAFFLLQPGVRRVLSEPVSELSVRASGARVPIFFLVFDELGLPSLLDEQGAIDPHRFPNLAELSAVATWYADTATVAETTQTVVPSLLTGRFPDLERLPTLGDHPLNLFTLFGGDYAVYAEEAITRLCPPEINRLGGHSPGFRQRMDSLAADLVVVWLHLTVPPRFTAELPPIDHDWGGFLAATDAVPVSPGAEATPGTRREFRRAGAGAIGAREQRLAELYQAIGPTERALYFFHLPYPHFPWEHLPSGRRYQRPRELALPAGRVWPESQEMVAQAYARYQLQLMYTDRIVGRFMARLRELDLFDSALVVVTADHGISFRPGSLRRHYAPETTAEIVAVPLLIKAPYQRQGEVVLAPVSLVDVLPTVLDLLDVPSPKDLDGDSVRSPSKGRPRYFVTGEGDRISLPPLGPQIAETAHRLSALMGGFLGEEGLVARGPHPELLGTRSRDLVIRERSDLRLTIDAPDRFESIDPSAPTQPLMVTGALHPPGEEECCDLAVTVGGRIQATTTSLVDSRGRHRWAALLPESALAVGSNRVEAFRIRSGHGSPVLERPALQLPRGSAVELAEDGRAGALLVDGEEIPIGRELRGFLGRVESDGREVRLRGWAVDLEARAPAEEVLFFYRGELVGTGAPALPQRGVVRLFKDQDYLESGFDARLPARLFPSLEDEGVRAFALSSRGAATELGYYYHTLETLADGSEAIRAGNGRLVRIAPGALRQLVDEVQRQEGELVVIGWAADLVAGEPASRMVAIERGRYHSQGRTGLPRPRLGELLGNEGLERSGFRFSLPLAAEEAIDRGELRLFAISKSRPFATEVSVSRSTAQRKVPHAAR